MCMYGGREWAAMGGGRAAVIAVPRLTVIHMYIV